MVGWRLWEPRRERRQLQREEWGILKPRVCRRKPEANYLTCQGAWAPGPREKRSGCVGRCTLPWGIPIAEGASLVCSSLTDLRLPGHPLLKGQTGSCALQALALPEFWVAGSSCSRFPGSWVLKGEVQTGRLQLRLGWGRPGEEGAGALGWAARGRLAVGRMPPRQQPISSCGPGSTCGGPWPEVAEHLVSLSPGLELQPGSTACAKLLLPTSREAFRVSCPAGGRQVSCCPKPSLPFRASPRVGGRTPVTQSRGWPGCDMDRW